jgi:hypothetical protein
MVDTQQSRRMADEDGSEITSKTSPIRQERVSRQYHRLYLLLMAFGLLFGPLIVPQVPSVQQLVGYGGIFFSRLATLAPTCGHPKDVFAKLFVGTTYTLPTKAQLEQLPTAIPSDQTWSQNDATYNPQTDILCAGGWSALYVRFVNPQPNSPGSTNYNPDSTPAGWVTDQLQSLWKSLAQGIAQFFQGILDWASSFGFMFSTPRTLTYGHAVVIHMYDWLLDVVDAAMGLFLIIGGYNYLFGQYRSFRELAPRLVLAAIAAHASLYFLGQFIEMQNALCWGIQQALLTAGIGNLKLPWGAINIVTAPEYVVLVYLIELLVAVLLIVQMLTRIALLDLLIVLSPVGLMCFALPQTRAWGRLWAQAFVSTLIVQFIQLLCIAMGSALTVSFGHASDTPVTILVGIAALFLAWKIPGMMLSNVLRAGHQGTNQQWSGLIETVTETAALIAA